MKHVGCLLTKLFGRKSAAMYLYSAFPSVVNSSCDTHTVYTSAWFGSKQSWKYSIGASNPTHLGDPHVILRQSRKARNLNFTFIPFSWIVFQWRNSEKKVLASQDGMGLSLGETRDVLFFVGWLFYLVLLGWIFFRIWEDVEKIQNYKWCKKWMRYMSIVDDYTQSVWMLKLFQL